ncbi:MAG: uracil-DNA glycosylase [Ectothiorhodospiraceae bacterium]|jgi:uracil-DNA glycosylase family 4
MGDASACGGNGGRPFDPACARCPRLADHLATIRRTYPDYHARPVPAYGSAQSALLVVGLAPGLHGANATGRPFTGDDSGKLLFRVLHRFGFSSAPEAHGAALINCRVTNAVRCLPPGNRPAAAEIRNCNAYLLWELGELPAGGVVLALGHVAHEAVVRAERLRRRELPFFHGAEHSLQRGRVLLDSYHCSRYNTQTGRLTEAMLETVAQRARGIVDPMGRARR